MSETFPDDVKYLARGKPKSPLLILGSSSHHWEFILGFAVDKVTVGRLSLLYFGLPCHSLFHQCSYQSITVSEL